MRRLTLAAAAVALLAVAAVGGHGWGDAAPGTAPSIGAMPDRAASQAATAWPSPPPTPMAFASRPAAAASAPPPGPPPLGSGETPDLRADAQGNLVIDVHARDELERLLALNDRADAQSLLQRLQASLPPSAYRQALDAFYAYQNYAIAAAQLTPPSQPVVDETGALRQLAALHALRVEHFGAATAAAYFGEEEATAQALLATMRANPDSGATLAERAEHAQGAAGTRP